jgi:hypothetical protein
MSELEMLRRRFETIERERTEAQTECHRLSRLLSNERNLKLKVEQELEDCKKKVEDESTNALARARLELTEELGELRRDYRAFRERTAKTLEEKDNEIIRARTSTDASTELAYLRDVILKYLANSNDVNSKTSMEAAIATVLRFNQTEVDFIRDKRRSDAGWKASLSSLGM